jgi:hypothetical protein
MPFMGSLLVAKPKKIVIPSSGIAPYIGIADYDAPKTTATILNLRDAKRGPNNDNRLNPLFTLTAEGNDAYYYAYPKEYGLASFMEMDSKGNVIGLGYGGWDGAHGDNSATLGPVEALITVNGQQVPFYIYVSDWQGLGQTWWRVT